MPPPLPPAVRLTWRWIAWALATLLLPIPPWFIEDERAFLVIVFLVLIGVLIELILSIYVAVGLSRNVIRSRWGSIFGLSLVLTLTSVGTGATMWLVVALFRSGRYGWR